jgi:3-oxoadipate enol-lactonase
MLTLSYERKITAGGVTISYNDSGLTGTETTPLIFIHGFPFDKSCWEHQFNYFKQTNRVITYDVRGFGDSGNNSEKPNIDLFADDLINLMDALKIEKAIVCGISMGGYILLNAIGRYPERFEAVILCNTQCSSDSIEAADKRHFAIQQIEAGGIHEFASGTVKKMFSADTQAHQKELAERLKNQVLSISPKILISTLNALLKRKDACSSLNRITVPTLILCGEEDSVISPSQSQFLHRNIPGSTFIKLEKAGHLSNLDQPEVFNKHVLKFISGL